MRENRTYGSEGGEAGEPAFPTPITGRRHHWTYWMYQRKPLGYENPRDRPRSVPGFLKG